MQIYSMQAKDTELIDLATDIHSRAERFLHGLAAVALFPSAISRSISPARRGSSNTPRLDGTNLATHHDVVVVTVNQRLNILGHMHLAELGGEDFAQSGNSGK